MSHGYSMKHIGITIVISLAVVVLISPLLRPKGDGPAPVAAGKAAVTPELRAAVREYRDKMAALYRSAELKYEAGALPLSDVWEAELRSQLAALDDFALDAPAGRDGAVTRAVVTAYFRDEIYRVWKDNLAALDENEQFRITEECCFARIELARRLPEAADNAAFTSARAAWEKKRSVENLKKMFDAEIEK